jgi:hypothetical protein
VQTASDGLIPTLPANLPEQFHMTADELTRFLTETLAAIPGIVKVETNIILKSVRSLFPGGNVTDISSRPGVTLAAVASSG